MLPTMTGPGESVTARVIRILESFGPEDDSVRISEIARRTELPLSTASRLVEELVQQGVLSRAEDRSATIAPRLWEIATRASWVARLRAAGLPAMRLVQGRTGQHTQLAIQQDREALVIERLSDPGSVVMRSTVAGRLPLHVTSVGLVLLAYATPEVQESYLAHPLAPYPARRQAPDPQEIRRQLSEVRRTGLSRCLGYLDETTTGIAVPVLDQHGGVVASLGAVVSHDQATPQLVELLRTAARSITRALAPDVG